MRIEIEPEALADIVLAIDICPVEISGTGRVQKENDALVVTEAIVFPQRCSHKRTEFDPDAYNAYCEALLRVGSGVDINQHRLWWHSHVWGDVFLSMRDLAYIEAFGASTPRSSNPWLISLVGNKHGHYFLQYNEFFPERRVLYKQRLYFGPEILLSRINFLRGERRERMEKLIQECVTVEDKDDEEERS